MRWCGLALLTAGGVACVSDGVHDHDAIPAPEHVASSAEPGAQQVVPAEAQVKLASSERPSAWTSPERVDGPDSAEVQRAVDRVRTQLSRSALQLRQQDAADGTSRVKVMSGFRHATMVVRGPDGVLRSHCVDDPAAAEQLLLGGE